MIKFFEKRQKYKQAIQQINRREVKLVPFVISNTGAIHKDGMSLLNKLADIKVDNLFSEIKIQIL